MQQFTLLLKDNTLKAFRSFIWFLLFLHLVAASVISINATDKTYHTIAIAAIILFAVIAMLFLLFKDQLKLYQLIFFISAILFWLLLSAWLPAIVVILMIVFAYRVSKTKSNVAVNTEKIIFKTSLFKKIYSWPQIENIVLKDHLLSIDLKNNQLIQTEIAAESFDIDETAFNQFCHEQLKTENSKP